MKHMWGACRLLKQLPWKKPNPAPLPFFPTLLARLAVPSQHDHPQWKFMCLKNRMYFKIAAVPEVIKACVLLYNFILTEDGVGKDEVFVDDMPTRRSRARRSNAGSASTDTGPTAAGGGAAGGSGGGAAGTGPGATGVEARQRETDYLAAKFMVEVWGEEGSALDRARKAAEARYRTVPRTGEGDESDG